MVGTRHQGAPDRQHLLLATGERQRRMTAALVQHGKRAIDLREHFRALGFRARIPSEPEIIFDTQGAEDLPAFGNLPDACAHALIR